LNEIQRNARYRRFIEVSAGAEELHHQSFNSSSISRSITLDWIGGGTGGGAIVGALAAGGKGTLIGSGIEAVAGTTAALVTGKKDVGFAAERRLRFRLTRDLSLASREQMSTLGE